MFSIYVDISTKTSHQEPKLTDFAVVIILLQVVEQIEFNQGNPTILPFHDCLFMIR